MFDCSNYNQCRWCNSREEEFLAMLDKLVLNSQFGDGVFNNIIIR